MPTYTREDGALLSGNVRILLLLDIPEEIDLPLLRTVQDGTRQTRAR
jgi:hypothetical protein